MTCKHCLMQGDTEICGPRLKFWEQSKYTTLQSMYSFRYLAPHLSKNFYAQLKNIAYIVEEGIQFGSRNNLCL